MLQDLLFEIDLRAEELMQQSLDMTTLRQCRSLNSIAQNQVFGPHLKEHFDWILGLTGHQTTWIDKLLSILENIIDMLTKKVMFFDVLLKSDQFNFSQLIH